MSKFFLYAVIVTLATSGASWVRAVSGDRDKSNYRGSTWSSFGGGGGSYGKGSGGGGHK